MNGTTVTNDRKSLSARRSAEERNAGAWLGIQAERSCYRDVLGARHEFSSDIANARRIGSGYMLVTAVRTAEAESNQKVIGVGRIGENRDGGEGLRTALFHRYHCFARAGSFDDEVSGGPQSNKTNSIDRIDLQVAFQLLARDGRATTEDAPLSSDPQKARRA